MYDGAEFWWTEKQFTIQKDSGPGSVSSKDGGVLASNVMLLAACVSPFPLCVFVTLWHLPSLCFCNALAGTRT